MLIRICATLKVSKRRACKALGQYRSTQRHRAFITDEERQLTRRIVELATAFGRYGYRSITALLRNEGWKVNHKRGGADLEERGVEGTEEATETEKVMAQ